MKPPRRTNWWSVALWTAVAVLLAHIAFKVAIYVLASHALLPW